MRRWRRAGREQLDALGLEGRLELALQGGPRRDRGEDWREAAAIAANEVDWAEFGLVDDGDL